MPSDCAGPALSETITGCLRKHLEQPRAPEGPLSEALGHLHLAAPPVEADAAPGSVPEETLVPGTCCFKCVCYGIGNFASCVTARSQLAFLLLLLERCQVSASFTVPPPPSPLLRLLRTLTEPLVALCRFPGVTAGCTTLCLVH